MRRDSRCNRVFQQIELIKYSEWVDTKEWKLHARKWQILANKSLGVVDAKKLSNMYKGGSMVKSLFDWLLIERAIVEIKKEYEND